MSTDNDYIYIESTTPGLTWRLYTHKPQGREPYALAIEGKLGLHSFQVVYALSGSGGSRQVKLPLDGKRLTAKTKATALADLQSKLRESGFIA